MSAISRSFDHAVALPARVLLGLIWLYRKTLSPVLPIVFGPGCGCRFHPTCAVYAAQAVRERGALSGMWLALRRLLKCHPLHPGGFDPFPARRRPIARRVPVWTRMPSSPEVDPDRRELNCSR